MDKRADLRGFFQKEENQALTAKQYQERTAQLNALESTMVQAFGALIQFMQGNTSKTEVVNQLKSISTPDVDKVVQAVSKLDKDILSNKLDLKPVTDALNGMKRELGLIPKSLPKIPEAKDSVKVTNLKEIQLDTSDVVKAIKDLKLVAEAPIINEKEVDLKPLQSIMLDLLKVVQSQKPVEIPKFPEIPKTDLTKVEKKLDTSNKLLKEITEKRFGGGGGGGGNGTPYIDDTGKASYVELSSDGSIPVSTPAKARDAASGANDTGIPAWYVRRDTPTTVTPIAGDWEPAQIDSMGAQWVREKSATTSAVTSVASSATNVTILALNAQRRGATIYNDSSAILYLKLGATASTSSFTVKMQAESYYEVPAQYTGIIDGLWASATGSARITEITS